MSFALKFKGEAESKLFASDLERKFAFRPGFIAPSGPKNTWKMVDYLFKPLQWLMPSIGVTSDELAHAMLHTAIGRQGGSLDVAWPLLLGFAAVESGVMRQSSCRSRKKPPPE